MAEDRKLWEGHSDDTKRWTDGVEDMGNEDGHYVEMVPPPRHTVSVKSYHSEDWYETENSFTLERKTSLAATLTHSLMYGTQPHRGASGISLHEKTNFQPQESLQDMYIENLLAQGKKRHPQKENIRAAMGFWKLIWFDFKHWYRRWRVKHGESVILKGYIKNMESNFGSAIGSFFVFIRWIMMLNLFFAVLWTSFVILPVAIKFDYTNVTENFAIRHLLDGEGFLANFWFFYGSYLPDSTNNYSISLAYLVMLLVTYFGSLYFIIESVTDSGERSMSSAFSKRYKFSMMLWTSWDFSITSREAASNLSKGIASVYKDNIYEAKALQDIKERSRRENVKVYSLRLLAWIITVVLTGGGCTAIVYVVLFMRFNSSNQSSEGTSGFVSTYGTTAIFMVINFTIPMCIKQLPKIEHYAKGKTELNITLTRIFFLRMANLFALISSLYDTVTKSVEGCAGTFIGQEMYKLVITDTILHSVFLLTFKFLKYYWSKEKTEFDMSSAVLVLVYRQSLVWVGTLASPVLPLIGMLSNIVFFSVNYGIVLRTCKPPIKRWNQSRNTSFFAVYLLASLGMLLLPASVIIGSSDLVNLGQTDVDGFFCGPFGSEKPTRAYTNFARTQTDWLYWILDRVVSEPVLIPLFMILITVLKHQYTKLGNEKKHCSLLMAELQEMSCLSFKKPGKCSMFGVLVSGELVLCKGLHGYYSWDADISSCRQRSNPWDGLTLSLLCSYLHHYQLIQGDVKPTLSQLSTTYHQRICLWK